MFGEIGRGGVHELHELGVGAVCRIDDRGLAGALLGEARGAGIGDPFCIGRSPCALRTALRFATRCAEVDAGDMMRVLLGLCATCNAFGGARKVFSSIAGAGGTPRRFNRRRHCRPKGFLIAGGGSTWPLSPRSTGSRFHGAWRLRGNDSPHGLYRNAIPRHSRGSGNSSASTLPEKGELSPRVRSYEEANKNLFLSQHKTQETLEWL